MKNNLTQKGFIVPVLLGVIAILIIGGGVYIYKNKKVEAPIIVNENEEVGLDNQQEIAPINTTVKNTNSTSQIIWEKDKSTGIFYPKGAEIENPPGLSYFLFTYKNMVIDFGEYSCDKNKFNFQYGISTEACIGDGIHPVLHPYNSPGRVLTAEEKNFFGDFILKNQEVKRPVTN